ncbi:DUF7344 domain-containing protein [Natrinema amylolyticum]|uniref:DUF7344 domain-containing protein n=1 Tax=Natrinema amylolyticum TaxID=2878679 RepID=UPI001CFBCC04|nr:hypothetical protein [Natrinema amylolyticum]
MGYDNYSDDFLSRVYHSLRAQRRRYVIELVAKCNDELSVRILAKEITAREQDVPVDRATGEPYRNVYNALSQTHLSTLSDVNIIIYDSERQVVVAGSNLTIALLLNNLNEIALQTLQSQGYTNKD